MLYLNDRDLRAAGLDWPALADAAEAAVHLIDSGDYAQPVKPYLRYKNPRNRIIAMPAYAGGAVNAAGIKWIASFPDNIYSGLPRAHSVIILNDPDTGQPAAVLNSPLPSIVRTAAVSGLMIRYYLRERPQEEIQLGIIGWGPIGQYHCQMAMALYGDRISKVRIYDIKGADLSGAPEHYRDRLEAAGSWEEVYVSSDIFITCTVSDHRYIDIPPARGSLLLNVSLRDYKPEALAPVKAVIVDDWEEVCRENTDIEQLHLRQGLTRSGTSTLADVVCRGSLRGLSSAEPVFFCPMGMGVFDIAIAVYYVNKARETGNGTELA
ncbi:2,3-diaminopropionate biosynthesis protein SbnB [Paenibacillus sp. MMS20-IR301]|uniref:2,3-diaminopropionate biosynthesis protein SbnB n=1 Tax=Paenibacillus sp. MMS20-IR301 TaxID=2895946 RepID=UPI0028EEAAF5|nr:2,3-diaminopropionate biosynthesis protein SbnB [Paenibacillus sp. MMS20-IR301]WNS46001.1 2,3-diaminopropionate biosynthesis protein SbnB [Paenibacillus sp. MMS20-IR301]